MDWLLAMIAVGAGFGGYLFGKWHGVRQYKRSIPRQALTAVLGLAIEIATRSSTKQEKAS